MSTNSSLIKNQSNQDQIRPQFLKNNNKNYDKKLEMLCLYNIACGYQILTFKKIKSNAVEQCLHYLQKSIQLNTQLLIKQTQCWFKMAELNVRMNLQYCALLSQIDGHQKALMISVNALECFKVLFFKVHEMCCKILDEERVSRQQKVSFTQNILKKARQTIQNLSNIQTFEALMNIYDSEQQSTFIKLKQKLYFWESNFENNEKSLRKQLNNQNKPIKTLNQTKNDLFLPVPSITKTNSNRNILGLKINNDWISTFTIGKIMHMKPLQYLVYVEADNIVSQFTYRHLIEKVFLASAIYFSIATEMRFMEGELSFNNAKNKKDDKATKNQMKKSQIFHLKSIETVCKHVNESSSFTDHLINSYHRHYNNSLATIQEESSSAEYSTYSIVSTCNLKKKQVIKGSLKIKQQQCSGYHKDYDESIPFRKQQKGSIALFNKKKKQTNLLQSGELSKDFSRSNKEIIAAGKGRLLKNMMSQKKSQKSISSTNFHSMKSADKKSFSIKGKDSFTLIRSNKSPQPSLKISKSKYERSLGKKSSTRLHTRR